MDIENIREQYNSLNRDLKQALSRMDLSNKVITIREEIKDLQALCPHNNGNFDFTQTTECPYCGRKFRK